MRVTAKGQVTIPLDVRRALGIVPGTELEFQLRGDHIDVCKAAERCEHQQTSSVQVTVADLQSLARTFCDLGDDAVMPRAWE